MPSELFPSTVSLNNSTQKQDPVPEKGTTEWKPRREELMVMISLAVISLMVSLDSTVIVPALPVSILFHSLLFASLN
jgi:hypothetical protein